MVFLHPGCDEEIRKELKLHGIEYTTLVREQVTDSDCVIVPVILENDGDSYSKTFFYHNYQVWKREEKEPTFIFYDRNFPHPETGAMGTVVEEMCANSPLGEMIALGFVEWDSVLAELSAKNEDTSDKREDGFKEGMYVYISEDDVCMTTGEHYYLRQSLSGDIIFLDDDNDKRYWSVDNVRNNFRPITKKWDDEYLGSFDGKYVLLSNGHDGLTQGTEYMIDYVGDGEFCLFDDNNEVLTISFDFYQRNFKRLLVKDVPTFEQLYNSLLIGKYL